MAFAPNKTLPTTVFEAARKSGASLRQRTRLRFAFAFASDEDLLELEKELTMEAVKAGEIKPEGVLDGIYQGRWTDLLDWIIANWDSILKMIMAIIGLFAAGPTIAGLLIAVALLLVPATASAACEGGVCRPRVLIERKVERTVVVNRPVVRVLQPVRRVVHRDRFLLYRRVLRVHGE